MSMITFTDADGVSRSVSADAPLPVEISESINLTMGSEVEIKNESGNPVPTEPLGIPQVARQLAAGAASSNTELTAECRRASLRAVGASIRYSVGSAAQTATAASHFIADGERLDIALPATPNIAIMRAGNIDGTLELTELG